MTISVNDIWRNMNVGFYTFRDKEKIPSKPGSYAWYYPLDIKSCNFEDMMKTIRIIYEYDSLKKNVPIVRENSFDLPWQTFTYSFQITLKKLARINNLEELWSQVTSAEHIKSFRVAMLKSSILLPPLYVGKTNNLYDRYNEHINSNINTTKSNFKKRFVEHMKANDINCSFEDLIFFAIPFDDLPDDTENFLEEIIKIIAKPIYSVK